MGRNGMVSSGHPLASQAGIAIMQKGGNAVDAAIATAAALSVVEPLMSGIGGDGFIMVYQKEADLLEISNGTGAAPYAATKERFSVEGIPDKGILSVSVPGLLHSWLDAHEKHGTLSLSELLAPAIDLAENGFPVSHVLSKAIASDPLICQFSTSKAVFTRDGRPLRPGEMLYQRDLAQTFKAIVAGGRKVFLRRGHRRGHREVLRRARRATYHEGHGRLPGSLGRTHRDFLQGSHSIRSAAQLQWTHTSPRTEHSGAV
jgi:gamma-glutamyltranspeptidase/glutathione hydrolase